jgi:hypothetical protein
MLIFKIYPSDQDRRFLNAWEVEVVDTYEL